MSKWELMTFMHVFDNPASSDLSRLLDEGWEPFATHEPNIMYFRRQKPDRARERTISKPKTVVEEIWEEMSRHANGMQPSNVALRMALAEAVEFIQRTNKQLDGMGIQYNNKSLPSILAILNGEKTRGIPKA